MQIIKDNPYRVLGLLAGAGIRELTSRAKKLRLYIEAEQSLDASEDFTLPMLGPINRTVESIQKSAATLSQNQDKAEAALFWFVNAGMLDENALEHLREFNEDSAAEIWAKWAKKEEEVEVSRRNFSAFHNLSTLRLNQAFASRRDSAQMLEDGIVLKIKLLESPCHKDLLSLVCDSNFKITKERLLEIFLNLTIQEAEKRGFSLLQVAGILQSVAFSAKDDYMSKFAQRSFNLLDQAVEECNKNRKASPQYANQFGQKLFDESEVPLEQVQTMLGLNNFKYTMYADKVAEEVLNCAVDYFKYHKDSESVDPSPNSMDCIKKATSIAVGNVTHQRCEENRSNLQEWIDEKPQREQQKEVVSDIQRLSQLIDQYEDAGTVQSARKLIQSSQPHLANICAKLGKNDEFYLGLSTRIAIEAQGMLVDEVNAAQKALENAYGNEQKRVAFLNLKASVDSAWEVVHTLRRMDLLNDFRKRLEENLSTLGSLRNTINQSISGSGGGTSGGGGCYIATLVYGDYDHPQVMVLRQYRDSVLSTSSSGRRFIRLYYEYSPRLVRWLRDKATLNRAIRLALDFFIKNIKIKEK